MPTSEQRIRLEELGVELYDHADFEQTGRRVGFSVFFHRFVRYQGVKLPDKWRLRETDAWMGGCPFSFLVSDDSGNKVMVVEQRPDDGLKWTGTLVVF